MKERKEEGNGVCAPSGSSHLACCLGRWRAPRRLCWNREQPLRREMGSPGRLFFGVFWDACLGRRSAMLCPQCIVPSVYRVRRAVCLALHAKGHLDVPWRVTYLWRLGRPAAGCYLVHANGIQAKHGAAAAGSRGRLAMGASGACARRVSPLVMGSPGSLERPSAGALQPPTGRR